MANKMRDIRRNHSSNSLIINNNENPIIEVKNWLEEAISKDIQDANAMVLCTIDSNSCPSSRIVLARDINSKGIIFYTNYLSDKAKDIDNNPNVSLNFYWKEIDKQIKIKGLVKKTSSEISDKYFASRPRKSQIGAWASFQSQKLNSYNDIIERFKQEESRFKGKTIERPPHWGGLIVIPSEIQFWKGKPSRLHENICFQKNQSGKWESFFKNP